MDSSYSWWYAPRARINLITSAERKQSSVAKLFMMKYAALCDADGVQVNWIGFYGSPRADRKLYEGRLHTNVYTPIFDFVDCPVIMVDLGLW
jgi:hypothetical protein